MSTKFPITLLLIEVCETLRESGTMATLHWVRRDDNQLADDLSNEEFGKFELERRIRVTKENCKWKVLDELLKESKELFDEVQAFKEKKRKAKADKLEAAGKKKKVLRQMVLLRLATQSLGSRLRCPITEAPSVGDR